MKKKRNLIIGLIIALLVVGFIGLKCFYLIYYSPKDLENDIKKIKFTEPLVIKKDNDVKEYLEHDGIKIRNDFKDFKEKDEQDSSYLRILTDESGKTEAAISMGKDYTWIDYLKEDEVTFYNAKPKKTTSKERINFLKKEKITNDIELFKFLNKEEKRKNNVFTPIKDIKGRYSIMLMASVFMPDVQSMTEIKGDYIGYTYNMKRAKEVDILKNNKRYIITFYDRDYFTDEYVEELLKTIVIEE